MNVPNANSPMLYFGSVYNTTVRTFTKPSAPTTDWVEDADQGNTTPDISVTNGSMIWTGSGATGDMDITCSVSITTYKHAFAVALDPPPATDYPITTSANLGLSASVTRSLAFNIAIAPVLGLGASVVRLISFLRGNTNAGSRQSLRWDE
jgi:hypothetical protein